MKVIKLDSKELATDETVLIDLLDVTVFSVDDMTWVAAESAQEAFDYCTKEMGFDIELTDIEECNIDKNGMWWVIDESCKYLQDKKEEDLSIARKEKRSPFYEQDEWEGEPAVFIPFREAIKLSKEKFPCIIATCLT